MKARLLKVCLVVRLVSWLVVGQPTAFPRTGPRAPWVPQSPR